MIFTIPVYWYCSGDSIWMQKRNKHVLIWRCFLSNCNLLWPLNNAITARWLNSVEVQRKNRWNAASVDGAGRRKRIVTGRATGITWRCCAWRSQEVRDRDINLIYNKCKIGSEKSSTMRIETCRENAWVYKQGRVLAAGGRESGCD